MDDGVAQQSGLSHGAVAPVLMDRRRGKEAVGGAASLKAAGPVRRPEGPTPGVEKLVLTWVGDKLIPLGTAVIIAKALIRTEVCKVERGQAQR